MQAFLTPHAPLLAPAAPRRPTTCSRHPTARAPPLTSSARATLTPSDPEAAPAPPAMPDAAPASLSASDEARIASVRAQMEFWFSASNLRRDWYLRRQMDPDGWLDPSIFLLFNRIKNLNASLGDIILACRTSDELEVSSPGAASFGDDAGQTRVRRSPELPDFRERDDHELARSFILKGIPADSTVDSLQALFEPLAPVAYVKIYRNKEFPDTPRALVCFKDDATADAVFERFKNDPPEAGRGIILKKRNTNLVDPDPTAPALQEGKPNLIVCHITGLSLDLDWRALFRALEHAFLEGASQSIRYLMYTAAADDCYVTTNDNEATRAFVASLTETGLQVGVSKTSVRLLDDHEELKEYWRLASEHQAARKARRAEREAMTTGSGSRDLMNRNPSGVIVKVEGLSPDATWREIKAELGTLGKLVYLNHERSSTVCFARFGSAEEAVLVRDALSGPDSMMICGNAVEAAVLTGDEEVQYWTRAEEVQKERRSYRSNQVELSRD